MKWRAIGKDREILAEVEALDDLEADNAILKLYHRLERGKQVEWKASWRSTGYLCEFYNGKEWEKA